MTPLGRIRALPLLLLAVLPALALAGCNGSDDPLAPGDGEVELTGTWAGTVSYTYYCEAMPSDIEFDIADGTLTVTSGGIFADGTTGTLTRQDGNSFTVTLQGDGGDVQGQLLVHSSGNHALLALYASPNSTQGYVGVLQQGPLTDVTYQESDLVGDWAGTAARVDASFAVTATSDSTVAVTSPDGLQLSGSDGDGSFSGAIPSIVLEHPADGIYVSGWSAASQIDWTNASYDAIYALSYDKTVLAAAFLTSVCDTTVFGDLPAQKFALWDFQP